ncbi:hypothetical protein SAMN05216228_102281 [Rhizobium tibeticum]|uniref:Uncharacterized protein n=1 Tax=Rhizobium tibeticum TaxID=501024 RepID=A0ABY1ARV4_9HYPH|nr:hypothetical protein SAMN05216228_102281 [Rhizobium tibeticum]
MGARQHFERRRILRGAACQLQERYQLDKATARSGSSQEDGLVAPFGIYCDGLTE